MGAWWFGIKHRNEVKDLEVALSRTTAAALAEIAGVVSSADRARALIALEHEVIALPASLSALRELAERVAALPIEKQLRPAVRFVGINEDVLSFRPHVQSMVDRPISFASMDFEVLLPGVVSNPIRFTGPACTIPPRSEWSASQEIQKTLPQAVVALIRKAHDDPKSNRRIGHEFPVHVRICSITVHGSDAKEIVTDAAIGTLVGNVQAEMAT